MSMGKSFVQRWAGGTPPADVVGKAERPCAPRAHLVKALPSAKSELGAVTLIGLTTGVLEIARLTGASSTDTPLAIWSSTSFCNEMESRYSIILLLRLVQSSCVMHLPESSPMQ